MQVSILKKKWFFFANLVTRCVASYQGMFCMNWAPEYQIISIMIICAYRCELEVELNPRVSDYQYHDNMYFTPSFLHSSVWSWSYLTHAVRYAVACHTPQNEKCANIFLVVQTLSWNFDSVNMWIKNDFFLQFSILEEKNISRGT